MHRCVTETLLWIIDAAAHLRRVDPPQSVGKCQFGSFLIPAAWGALAVAPQPGGDGRIIWRRWWPSRGRDPTFRLPHCPFQGTPISSARNQVKGHLKRALCPFRPPGSAGVDSEWNPVGFLNSGKHLHKKGRNSGQQKDAILLLWFLRRRFLPINKNVLDGDEVDKISERSGGHRSDDVAKSINPKSIRESGLKVAFSGSEIK